MKSMFHHCRDYYSVLLPATVVVTQFQLTRRILMLISSIKEMKTQISL